MPPALPICPGSRALRRGRISISGQVYLVTFTTHGRRPLFGDFDSGCLACRALTDPAHWVRSSLFVWILMPDHWHGLVQVGEPDSLSTCVARIQSAVTRDMRKLAGRPINVWASGFHDRALRREDDIRAVARYIVLNPVRRGIVANAWSCSFWDAIWVEGMAAGRG